MSLIYRRSVPGVASALLLLSAFPPLNFHWIVTIALVPWLMSLRNKKGKEAWKSGYGFGLVFSAGQLFWIFSLSDRWIGNSTLSVIPWLLASAAMAVYLGLTGLFISKAWQCGRPWLIPLLWVGVEVFRSYIPVLAFPWGLLASPLWPYPALVQSASLGSIYWISALVVAINVTFCVLLNGDPWAWAFPLPPIIGLSLAGSLVWWWIPQNRPLVKITAGQPGVDLAFGEASAEAFHVSRAVEDLTQQAETSGSELLVLPEGLGGAGDKIPPQMPFSLSQTVPTLFGARRGRDTVYQSAFAYDGSWSYVDKTRLVIFGEFVPGRGIIPLLDKFNLPTGDISPGTNPVHPLRVGNLNVGPLICFEGLFPDLSYRQGIQGAQVIAVMSVDDWFLGTSAPDQLRAGSIWRAIETGLPVVRSASQGYTMIIDGQGRILNEASLFGRRSVTVNVPVPQSSPTYPGLPAFPLACLLSPFGLLRVRGRRLAVSSWRLAERRSANR